LRDLKTYLGDRSAAVHAKRLLPARAVEFQGNLLHCGASARGIMSAS
jgi:hypothetical protein